MVARIVEQLHYEIGKAAEFHLERSRRRAIAFDVREEAFASILKAQVPLRRLWDRGQSYSRAPRID